MSLMGLTNFWHLPDLSGTNFCTRDFAFPGPEFRAELETNFGRPNFGPEFLGRFFDSVCFFPAKLAPKEFLQWGSFLIQGFAKGWFWQMSPCTNMCPKKSLAARLPWKKKARNLDMLGPPKPERGYVGQSRPLQTAFGFLSNMWLQLDRELKMCMDTAVPEGGHPLQRNLDQCWRCQ